MVPDPGARDNRSDEHAINLAQSEFRDAINGGDVDAAMRVVAEAFTWMRDSEPSYWGKEGNCALRLWIEWQIRQRLQMTITPDLTQFFGKQALSRGWETLERGGANGELCKTRFRYFQTWEKSQDGNWRMTSFICNKDVPPKMLES